MRRTVDEHHPHQLHLLGATRLKLVPGHADVAAGPPSRGDEDAPAATMTKSLEQYSATVPSCLMSPSTSTRDFVTTTPTMTSLTISDAFRTATLSL